VERSMQSNAFVNLFRPFVFIFVPTMTKKGTDVDEILKVDSNWANWFWSPLTKRMGFREGTEQI